MASIQILDRNVEIDFQKGANAKRDLNPSKLVDGAQEMAELINSKRELWTIDQRTAFESIGKIVFFEGQVMVNGHLMDRPCCDEDDAVFYWEAEEFEKNTDADVRANTFFHDCWHVVQFRRAGNKFAQPGQEQVEREIDAIGEQIEVAKILGNDMSEIRFLENFRNDQAAIKARLDEGVGDKIAPHKIGAARPESLPAV